MKKRVLGILLALVMIVSLVPERVMAVEPVHYITWNGDGTPEDNECSSYTTIGTESYTWNKGWYVVTGRVTIIGTRVIVNGDVHLILCDGAEITVTRGITVSENDSLTIYGQKDGTGSLDVETGNYGYCTGCAGIGGDNAKGGTITINGGIISSKGGQSGGAGIGGGNLGAGGTITINGGTVTATGMGSGAGIGGGYSGACGKITINGGTVTATGSNNGAGIGRGGYSSGAGGEITINGGTVTATGGWNDGAAGIGVGSGATGGTVSVSDKMEIKAGDTADTASYVASDAFDPSLHKYVYASETQNHNDIIFNIWKDTTSLPDNPGNYFLSADVTLSSTWSVPAGTTNLCLNGHVIIAAGGIGVSAGSTLNIYDCNTTTVHKFKDTDGYWKLDESGSRQVTGGIITADGAETKCVWINGGELTINGGSICGSNKNVAVYVCAGKFTMNDGNICGNRGAYGGAVWVANNTSFTMNGGSIHDNQANSGGGVYVQDGTFSMNGGEIRENIADSYGGGVFACKNELVFVSGNSKIRGNRVVSASGMESNIHLQDNYKTILSVLSNQPLTDGADIGVTLYIIDKDADWKAGTEVGSYFNETLTSDSYQYFTINNAGDIDKGTVYRVAQIGASPNFYYVRGGNFSVTGYTDSATPSLGSVTPDKTTCEDGATVTLTVSPTTGYMLTEGSLKASYPDPSDAGKSIDCVLTQDAQDSSKYTFAMPAADVTITAAFEKLVAKVTKDPEAKILVYTGSAQALVTAGEAADGTMKYALGENGTAAPETGWNDAIPTGTSAETNGGTYYVWYKAAGSNGADDSAAACVTVTISKKDITNAAVGAFEAMTYDGKAQTPSAAVTIDGLTATGSWDSVTNVADTTTFAASGNFTGEITGKATGMAKRIPAAPTGLDSVKPSEIGKNDGKITGTTAAMEYSTVQTFSDAKTCTGTEITGLAAGTYFVRIKETANETASNYVSITVSDGDKKNFNTVVIDNYNGVYDGNAHGITVSGVPAGATVMYGTIEGTYDKNSSITYTDFTDGAKTVYVKVSAENYNDLFTSGTVNITKRIPAAPNGLDSVKPSEIGKNDGKITGTTAAMEYSTVQTFSDAKTCTGTEITGLAAGTYFVRIKETANETASNYVSVTVSDGDKKNFTTVVIDNYNGVYDGNAHGITVSGVPAGATVMYGTIEGTYDKNSSITYTDFTDGAKTVYVKVSAENYNDLFTSGTVNITKRIPAAPAGLDSVKPSEFGKSDGKITGTTAAMEYGTDAAFSDAKPCTGTEITGLVAGTYYVRIKETANETASNYVSVTVLDGDKKNPTPDPDPEPTPEPDPIIVIPPQTTPAPTQDDPAVPETPAESYTVPVKGEVTVKVEAELKDGNAEVKDITSKDLEKIFGGASDEDAKPVTVDLSDTKQEINSVTLTKKSVENIAEVVADESNPADSLEVKFTNADLVLDDKAVAAVNEQAKGEDIRLIVDEGEDIELNKAQQKAVESENVVTVIDARILSNGKEIHKLNGGSALIKIKPDGEKILKNRKYTVKYVSEDGTVEVIETTTDGSHIIFKISHFSNYVIVYDEKAEDDTEVKAVKAPYIKLSKTIGLGNTFNMAVTNVADDANVKYSSSDKSVATVDRNGVITAVGIGKCTVKGVIKQHGTTYKFAVAVTVKDTGKGNRQIKADECLTPNSITPLLNVYKAVNTARPLALNIKRLAEDAVVTFSSEDESIAVVSKDGVITGLKKGYTGINVYVKQNGLTLQYRVFVRVSDN